MPRIFNIVVGKKKGPPPPPPPPPTICLVSSGYCHTLAIDSNGRVWGWGINNTGQLGDNSTINRNTPVSVRGTTKTFCKISTGIFNTVAIDKNGRAWGWGLNNAGQLGDNSNTNRCTPVSVLGVTKTFCEISGGSSHTVVIDKNGLVWAWGNNSNGQLGDNTITSRITPVSVLGATKTFCQIVGSTFSTHGIDKNGQVWSWGSNIYGQLGDNSFVSKRTPVSILGTTKTFCKIDSGDNCHVMAIDKNGRAWGWGINTAGQLGDNSTAQRLTPVSVSGLTKTFCKIATGVDHTVAIDKNGQAWSWGSNVQGQLGDNTITSRRTPVSVCGSAKTFCEITAGAAFTVSVDYLGKVWAWGVNSVGQLGDNSFQSRITPVSVLGATKTFCQIANSLFCQTLAIDKNGRAWAWGSNSFGELGDNSILPRSTPVSVAGAIKTFCKISGGQNHTIAIDKNGRAWGWGLNNLGQLGDNSNTNRCTPVSVLGVTKTFCEISTGASHTVAIDKNGQAWGWGVNNRGQLGDNTITSRRTPVSVLGVTKTFCKISTGIFHTVAIDINGHVWGWGLNDAGQLGDNTLTSRRTPVSVLGVTKTFCKISAGFYHTLAIDKNGRAWGWGQNFSNELGNGDPPGGDGIKTPVSVAGTTKTFCQISGGANHSAAIDKNGQVWSWGRNNIGQLGDNSTTQQCTPVAVVGVSKTFCQIAAGTCHTVAVDKNGRIWAWGANNFGQLGENSGRKLTPVQVCNI